MDKLKSAILKTVCYADVFDFPLKEQEVYLFLITSKEVSKETVVQSLSWLKKEGLIEEKEGFFFLSGRKKSLKLRREREEWSIEKLKIAKKVANFLKFLALVKMVAVTGALARNNVKRDDDIDFLIVTQKGRIWTTRFLVTVLAQILGKRRQPGDRKVADKICLNMFLDEDHLAVPVEERDLFSAHEVVQLKALWDEDNTYQKFLWENRWVRKFLPNALRERKAKSEKRKATTKSLKLQNKKLLALSCSSKFCTLHFAPVETVLKHFQLWYMRKRRTTEITTDGIIRFHPKDARVWVLKEYKRRLTTYGMILK